MTLDEMIERLIEIRDDFEVSGDTRIRGAFQPSYPLVGGIAAITTIVSDDENEAGIYIALGDGHNYGFGAMWDDDIVERDSEEDEDEEDGE
jgi:hypothetical protein